MPLSVTTLNRARRRLIDMHFRAKAGHIGGNLSCLDAMMLIHHEYLEDRRQVHFVKRTFCGRALCHLVELGRLTDSDLDRFHQDDTLLGGPSAGERNPGGSFRDRQPWAWLVAGGRFGSRGKTAGGQSAHLLLDLRWRMAGGLDASKPRSFRPIIGFDNLTILVDHNGLQGFGTTDAVASMDPLE